MVMDFYHVPVFFKEAVQALNIRPDGIYADCTAGGGGHSAAIAENLKTGKLIAIDRDPQAIEFLKEKFNDCKNISLVHANFFNLRSILSEQGYDCADGILADLGVSSHQLDTPQRGFSFHQNAPLDMRMSMSGKSAADVVNGYSEAELRRILYDYGEERYSPSIAAKIVKARELKQIQTTFELVEIIKAAIPAAARREGRHPARRTFQAIRIEVNGELENLQNAVETMFSLLSPSGRLAIIAFHSLEDRIVKKTFASLCSGCTCPPEFPICVCGKIPQGRLPFKAQKPSSDEMEHNPRSKSARLRVIEKIERRA
jgi:16S rRNA (cytosine1402-N4)-methyltransferase